MVESRVSIKELALGLTEPQRLASVGWNRGGGVVHSAHRLAHLADLRDQSRVSGAAHTFRSLRLLNAPGNSLLGTLDPK